jgi:hypothetical protein
VDSNVLNDSAKTLTNGNRQGKKEINPINSVLSTWDEPILPGQICTPEIPASVIPDWLGGYADAVSKNTQTPSGMSVLMSLSVLATCVQKRFEVCPYRDDYKEPLSLWTATAMPPASRKTAVINAFTAPLFEWENKEQEKLKDTILDIEAKRAVTLKAIDRLQKDAAQVKDSTERMECIREIKQLKSEMPDEVFPPRLWTTDITPERLQSLMAEHGERMALLGDEGGIFEVMAGLYSDGRANLDVFLQGHAGAPVRVDRGQRTVCLQKPALTFGIAIQPQVLSDFGHGSKKRFRGIGTLARFLYCLPKSNIGSRRSGERQAIPESIKMAYENGISNLLNILPQLDENGIEKPRILYLDQEALDAWIRFSQYIESKQGEGGELEPIQDWAGKLPGAALRIAGLCHVARYGEKSLEVDREIMEKALDLCELLIPHAQASFDMMGADQAVDDAKVILKWILIHGERSFKRSECHKKHHGRFKKLDRLIKALEVLQGWNVISEANRVKPGGTGRPSIIYSVNPAVLKGGM